MTQGYKRKRGTKVVSGLRSRCVFRVGESGGVCHEVLKC